MNYWRQNLRQSQKDLGGSVETRLDIRINSLTFVTCRSKIDNLDNGAFQTASRIMVSHATRAEAKIRQDLLLQQDIFGFQIAMDQSSLLQEAQPV